MTSTIRVSFAATTLSGILHVTEFEIPGVVGDDQINSISLVATGERVCTLKWDVQLRPPQPRVHSFAAEEVGRALEDVPLPETEEEKAERKAAKKAARKAAEQAAAEEIEDE